MPKAIMIQGTGSGAGKSILSARLSAAFFQGGSRVALARSQVVQTEAAGIEPSADMNPLLFKPNSDTGCQVRSGLDMTKVYRILNDEVKIY